VTWRSRFIRRIADVVDEYRHDEGAMSLALLRAYPLEVPWRGGPGYPYRVWRDEVARQLGRKPELTRRHPAERCAYTRELFDTRCPLTLDMFG
jgi:hypothetical protein